jgi:hypothetical protein
MTFIFWTFWVADLLLTLLVFMGKDFRRSWGGGIDLNMALGAAMVICLIGSLALRFVLRRELWSVIVAGLPLLGVLLWYLVDKAKS